MCATVLQRTLLADGHAEDAGNSQSCNGEHNGRVVTGSLDDCRSSSQGVGTGRQALLSRSGLGDAVSSNLDIDLQLGSIRDVKDRLNTDAGRQQTIDGLDALVHISDSRVGISGASNGRSSVVDSIDQSGLVVADGGQLAGSQAVNRAAQGGDTLLSQETLDRGLSLGGVLNIIKNNGRY